MTLTDFTTYLIPTIVIDGAGNFHPGIRYGLQTHYWANHVFHSEDDAWRAATLAVNDALEAANGIIGQWNLTSFT